MHNSGDILRLQFGLGALTRPLFELQCREAGTVRIVKYESPYVHHHTRHLFGCHPRDKFDRAKTHTAMHAMHSDGLVITVNTITENMLDKTALTSSSMRSECI